MNDLQRHARVGELFLAVCDLSGDDQIAYLNRTCGLDSDLSDDVRRLIEEDSRAEIRLAADVHNRKRFGKSTIGSRKHRLDKAPPHQRPRLDKAVRTGQSAPAPELPRAVFPSVPGYRIEGILGRGGFGVVYRALDLNLGREVAIKVLPALHGTTNPSVVERFKREASAASRLRHENIVPIYDFGQSDDCYFYTMELVAGAPLNEVLRRLRARFRNDGKETDGKDALEGFEQSSPPKPTRRAIAAQVPSGFADDLPWLTDGEVPFKRGYFKRIAEWMAAVADALHCAHGRGIIHRDIKPGNLILADDGRIMVTDFGLALAEDEETITRTGAIMGTLRYLSPEQALGGRVPVDHRTDVYSLGATLYELLTMHPLFSREDEKQLLSAIIGQPPSPPSSLNPAVPTDLETICLKALEKTPGARYATAMDLAKDLRAFVGDQSIAAKRTRFTRRTAQMGRRHKVGLFATVATLLLVWVGLLLNGAHRRARLDARVGELTSSGLVLQQDHRWNDAAKTYLAALELDPLSVRALGNLAILRKEQHNLQEQPDPSLLVEADDYLRRALDIAPENAGLWNVMGVVQKMLGAYEEAIEAYQAGLSVVDAPPEYVIAMLNNMAEAHLLLGDFESAEAGIRGAVQVAEETNTPAWYAWQDLAALELAQGDAQAAVSIGKAFASKSEPNWRLHVTRARIHLTIDEVMDIPAAVRDAYAAMEEADPDPRVARVMAMALLRNGDYAEAVAHAQEALALGDVAAFDHLISAIAEVSQGDVQAAKTHLANARSVWPAELTDVGYTISTARGMLWFDTEHELITLLEEAELLLDEDS